MRKYFLNAYFSRLSLSASGIPQIDKSAQRENAQQWNKVAEENRHEMQEKSAAAKAGKPTACCAVM